MEKARFIAGSANDTALIGRRPNNERLSAIDRIVALLDGRKKCIHINMKNNPRHYM